MPSHKAGSLKQSNKKHKGKPGKRQSLRALGPGRTTTSKKTTSSKAVHAADEKTNRRNRNNQIKYQKREQVWLQKRLGSSTGSSKIVAVVTLSDTASPQKCVELCLDEIKRSGGKVTSTDLESGRKNTVMHAHCNVHGSQQFTFVTAPAEQQRDLFCVLDLARAADMIMFVLEVPEDGDVSNMIDDVGLNAVSALKAQGCPDTFFCVDGLIQATSPNTLAMDISPNQSTNKKKKNSSNIHVLRKQIHQYISDNALFPEARLVEMTSPMQLMRTLCNVMPKSIAWRSSRSYIVADSVEILSSSNTIGTGETDGNNDSSTKCNVRVSGYLRGKPMNVHSLMHIVGVGAGKIVKVSKEEPPLRRLVKAGTLATSSCSGIGDTRAPGLFEALNTVYANPEKQDSLELEAAHNVLMGEQTWPSDAEMTNADGDGAEDNAAGRDRRTLPANQKLPVGMSSYQADWYMDEEGNVDFGNDEDGGDNDDGKSLDAGTLADLGSINDPARSRAAMRAATEAASKRTDNATAAAEDREFPDEVNTPIDISARTRFARYRALQSFRASPWHPKENLPQEYARIFQFENFPGMQRKFMAQSRAVEKLQSSLALEEKSVQRALSNSGSVVSRARSRAQSAAASGGDDGTMISMDADDGDNLDDGFGREHMETDCVVPKISSEPIGTTVTSQLTVMGTEDYVQAGCYVSIEISDVPRTALNDRIQRNGLMLCFALLPHEHKMSVLHFNVQRCTPTVLSAHNEPIKSKEEMLFQVGFRSFITKPIYSESNLNCDKHKFERFLQSDRFSIASCFGPIYMSHVPLLVFKRVVRSEPSDDGQQMNTTSQDSQHFSNNGGWTLVATGSLMSVDPDRIILKKIILTGYPIRVRKKWAVVKHLFYDPQDVRWFKPAELVTKFGLRGVIKEPVGTHGLLKGHFSDIIKQNDTVMLILYKRVYPKFPEGGVQLM